MHEALFDYLEQDMAGDSTSTWMPDPAVHAAALANDDWTDAEAGQEIRRAAGREQVLGAYVDVVRALAQNPAVDRRGIRMARILRNALDGFEDPAPARTIVPVPPKRRRWWRAGDSHMN